MFLHFRGGHAALAAAFVLGAVVTHRAGAAGVLNVCVDQANPTAAMDRRVARAIAKTQGMEIKEVPFEGHGKGDDGFPPSRFAKMADSECELIMGFPVDVSNPNLPANVQATSAYASTGFVLVRRGGGKDVALDELPKGSEVGIAQLDTYAGLLYGIHKNIVMHVYEKDSQMVRDLVAKHIAAGVAWQPSIESYESGHPHSGAIAMQPLTERHMVWNLVALYVPHSAEAAKAFDKGLGELQAQGGIKPLISPYQQAAVVNLRPTSAQRPVAPWPEARLQPAMAWDTQPGQFIQVADKASGSKPKAGGKVPALYTADQATKGQLAYYQNCSMCHGPNLDGQSGGYSGPALKGKDFADPSYDFHVSDIFNFVSKQMPAATPGSLSHEQYEQIMAFILQQNGYPAGDKALTYSDAEGSKVPIRYHGK